ncbi:hypothetical protein FRAAL4840 [Frankia alni ACN14a]|uniref:Uncharacterized protein n=1 Tax=Frankia alni (strain DSM 45986 / CECT 9034 / ACN14a) TaxID=326424 RepID=Q0RGA7_FRAAA|nr:hypothetical protein FRAAL4840 [Frankia alni ACN14a]
MSRLREATKATPPLCQAAERSVRRPPTTARGVAGCSARLWTDRRAPGYSQAVGTGRPPRFVILDAFWNSRRAHHFDQVCC